MLDSYETEPMASAHHHHFHHGLASLSATSHHQFDDYQMTSAPILDESIKYGGSTSSSNSSSSGSQSATLNSTYGGTSKRTTSVQMYSLPFDQAPNICVDKTGVNRFHIVLMAPTSPAAKVNEESLTYLNQGQNYDLRLSYNNSCEPPNAEAKMLLSVVRLCFWERKMQEIEEEEIQKWKKEYPHMRMLEIENNSSQGFAEIRLPSLYINIGEVLWRSSDPCTTITVRCNCTSTAFAPHKHGGEKGIHMRLQVDTFEMLPGGENGAAAGVDTSKSGFVKSELELEAGAKPMRKHLCSSYCRIQLFRLKGAQRKLKTDKAKIDRLNPIDLRRRYQQSAKFTQLYNSQFDALYSMVPVLSSSNMGSPDVTAAANICGGGQGAGLLGLVDPNEVAVAQQFATVSAASYADFPGAECAPPGAIMNDFLETSLSATSSLINTSGASMVYNSLGYPNQADMGLEAHESHSASQIDLFPTFDYPDNPSAMQPTRAYAHPDVIQSGQQMFGVKRKSSLTNPSSSGVPPPSTLTPLAYNKPAGQAAQFNSFRNKMSKSSSCSISPSLSSASSTSSSSFVSSPLSPLSPDTAANFFLINSHSNAPKRDSLPAVPSTKLAPNCSCAYVQEWLQSQRFHHLMPLLGSYASNDVLRLSKSDMVNLCGAPDGIRLFNAVHNIQLKPRLHMFVTLEQRFFHAVYLLGDDKLHTLATQLGRLFPSHVARSHSTPASASTVSQDKENGSEPVPVEVKVEFAANGVPLSSNSEQENPRSSGPDENQMFLKVNDILVKLSEDVLNNLTDRAKFLVEFEAREDELDYPTRTVLTQLD